MTASRPHFELESACSGVVCGVDEAGRGPLAGPVVAAAVILEPVHIPPGINDSKKTTHTQRMAVYQALLDVARVGIGIGTLADIETFNILGATKLAMARAVENLGCGVDMALVDGNQPPRLTCRVQAVVKGDSVSLSIAAASIIAKVTRDEMMAALAQEYPHYGFEKHKGYGTCQHLEAIARYGVSPVHRRGFAPVQQALAAQRLAG